MDLWKQLRAYTQAKIGLGRTGHSSSTRDQLDYRIAHALARDAVHEVWDLHRFEEQWKEAGVPLIEVKTGAHIREQYLQYPSLGRTLCEKSREKLQRYAARHVVDIAFIITDGLSAHAVDAHMLHFWNVFHPLFQNEFCKLKSALVAAPFGRVALSDDVGEALGAKMSIIFVGERPGLSSIDSLGIYLTYAPKRGNTDALRNCISNIHPPEGLAYASAADKLLYLIGESLRRKLSGVALKEEALHLPEHLPSRLGLGI